MSDFIGSISKNILYKDKNETIEIFSTVVYTDLSLNSIKIIQLDNLNTTTILDTSNIQFSNVGSSLTKVNITLPNIDCFICVLFNGKSVLLRVGNPDLKLVLYKPNLDSNVINIKQFDSNALTRYDTVMLSAGNDIYYYNIEDNNIDNDFVEITTTTEKMIFRIKHEIINNQTTVSLQTIFYDWE